MKIVISGPFGLGSLADEAVLAGVLARLGAKHEYTILSAHPDRVLAIHQHEHVKAVELAAPGSLLSTPDAWQAVAKSHLLIVLSGGTISESGNPPARTWLSHTEHARTLGIKSAVVGIGARPIPDARDRTRVQRLLHNFTDCLSARDEESKLALVGYALSSSRISNNGSTVLALGDKAPKATPNGPRVGLVITPRIPSHHDFSFEEVHASGPVLAATQALAQGVLATDGDVRLSVFHDATDAAEIHAKALLPKGTPSTRVDFIAANRPIDAIREAMAACDVIFSLSLQSAILATTAGVPALAPEQETGLRAFVDSVMPGGAWVIAAGQNGEPFDVEAALERIQQVRADSAKLRETVAARLKLLIRKEAQNGRMLELLVPRRDRWDPDQVRDARDAGARAPVGKRKGRTRSSSSASGESEEAWPISGESFDPPARKPRGRGRNG